MHCYHNYVYFMGGNVWFATCYSTKLKEVLTGNRNLNWEYFCIIMLQGIKRENSFKVLDNVKKQV